VLAIDAGTGSCRAVVFDASGARLSQDQCEWSHAPEDGVPGSQVFAAADNWALIGSCCRAAIAGAGIEAGRIGAVTATSMREGMVLFDEGGHELWACPNVDGRAGAEAAELVADGSAEEIYARAGDWVAITSPPRFLWLRKHRPEVLDRAVAVGMLSDWVVFRLCGVHATDPSAGSSSALFDLADRTWSPALLGRLGLDPAIFPPVHEPGTVIGEVTEAAAAATGLAAGTPVCVGGADTQLGLVGLGVVEPGAFTVVGGSFWQSTGTLAEPVIDPEGRLRTLCHAVPDQWMIEGIGFWSGLALRWFRDAFCPDATGNGAYAAMEAEAARVPPGANGVVGLFSNAMRAKRWVHASPGFVGFDLTDPARSGRGACIRAIQEAAAYVVHAHQRIVETLTGRSFTELVFTGGASSGSLWAQIIADVTGLPVRVPRMPESTALGAAVLAGAGAGVYSDAAAVLEGVVELAPPREPDAQAHARYGELEARWAAVYDRSLAMAEEGLLEPMWMAAGA
jgi:autoinducer-2 kinase